MQMVELVIRGDLATGGIQVQGPIHDLRLMHWLLGETRRVCEREANKREAGQGNGQIILARGNLPPAPPGLSLER